MKRMKKKNPYLTAGIIAVSVLALIFLAVLLDKSNQEKSKAEENVSNESIPDYILLQQRALHEAIQLYQRKKAEGMNFSSQCLGIVADNSYVVDIVHTPRTIEDDRQENQCQEFLKGQVRHFIELNKDGSIIRVV